MKFARWIVGFLFALIVCVGTARGQCTQQTPNIGLQLPSIGQTNTWGICVNGDLQTIDTLLGGTIALPTGTTPALAVGYSNFITANTGATAITNFLNGFPGQTIRIICGTSDVGTAVAPGLSILLSGSWACPGSVSLTLTLVGNTWVETGRNGGGGAGASVALKPPASSNMRFATVGGNDANDGLSWGTAKLTWTGACESLPGGSVSPPTCGTGAIYYSQGTAANPIATAGIWLFGSLDPGYASGVSGWNRYTGPIKSVCQGPADTVINNGTPVCYLTGGATTDNAHPLIWLSSINGGMEFDGLETKYQGQQIVFSVCSNGVNNGTCAVQDVVFKGVQSTMGNATAGLGPPWMIGDGTFWIYVNDYNISGNANNSPTADNGAAVLLTKNVTQSSLIQFHDGGFNTGGIKYYAGPGAYLLVNGQTTTENNLEAVLWVLGGTDMSTSTIEVDNAGVSDCNLAVAHCAIIRNDDPGYVHVRGISGPTMGLVIADAPQNDFPDTTINSVGPRMYEMNSGNTAPNVEIVRSQGGNPQKMFSPSVAAAVNLVDIGTGLCPGNTCTVTGGIADPSESGTGAINVTDSSAASAFYFTLASNGGAVQGDTYVVSMWTRSTNGNGYPRAFPFQLSLQGGGERCNGSSTGVIQPTSLTTTENGWTHYVSICKLTSYGGAIPLFGVLTGSAKPIQAYAPMVIRLHGLSDEEVLNEALNMGSWTKACAVGQLCDMQGPVPHYLTATSASFSAATTAGTCVSNITAVPGAATGMAVSVSPVITPGTNWQASGYVSGAGNVTIIECAVTTSAGGNVAWNIRVIE